jgi:hypothetical protein
MILNIVSYPRSGNSFFTTQLLQFGSTWKYQGRDVIFKPVARLFAFEHAEYDVERVDWNNKPTIPGEEDFQPNDYIMDQTSVYVYKRHDFPGGFAGPRIYLLRDGRDVLLSFARHKVLNRALLADSRNQELICRQELPMRLLNEEANRILDDPNAQWGDTVINGVDHINTHAVVKYEGLKRDGLFICIAALANAGYKVTKVTEPPTWADLKARAPQFYWRGRVGNYHCLHPDIIRTFERKNEKALKRFGYL